MYSFPGEFLLPLSREDLLISQGNKVIVFSGGEGGQVSQQSPYKTRGLLSWGFLDCDTALCALHQPKAVLIALVGLG